MNIRDLNIGSNRPDPRRTDAAGNARKADGNESAGHSAGTDRTGGASEDRVEISKAARAALAQRPDAADAAVPSAVREALSNQPSTLDPARKAELQQRVADGYYQQDAVVEQVAERLAADLGAEASDEASRS